MYIVSISYRVTIQKHRCAPVAKGVYDPAFGGVPCCHQSKLPMRLVLQTSLYIVRQYTTLINNKIRQQLLDAQNMGTVRTEVFCGPSAFRCLFFLTLSRSSHLYFW